MIIDVYSDFLCPWCFLGERRLRRVLADIDGDFEIRFRAFQLQPGLPPAGVSRTELLERRYGAAADPARVPEKIAAAAAAEGLTLNYEAMTRVPNTLATHRLVAAANTLAPETRYDLVDHLFSAYFLEGADLSNPDVLLALAEPFNVRDAAAAVVGDGPYAEQVAADLGAAEALEVVGVPNLCFAGRFSLPGVQSDDTLRHFIQRAAARLA